MYMECDKNVILKKIKEIYINMLEKIILQNWLSYFDKFYSVKSKIQPLPLNKSFIAINLLELNCIMKKITCLDFEQIYKITSYSNWETIY